MESPERRLKQKQLGGKSDGDVMVGVSQVPSTSGVPTQQLELGNHPIPLREKGEASQATRQGNPCLPTRQSKHQNNEQ